MARGKMAPVYVGDVGQIHTYNREKVGLPEFDLSTLPLRDLCNLALKVGFDVREIIGVPSCEDHLKMVILHNTMPEGMNLFEHCVYCKNCWQFFRLKRL